jgi:hypothetical protein
MNAATEAPTTTNTKTAIKYPRNWSAYHKCRTTEKEQFRILLHELCRTVQPFERKNGCGRMPVSASDAIFAAVYKVYSTLSMERFASDLKDAVAAKFVSRAIHCNSISAYLGKYDLTMRLHALIRLTSLPFKDFETVFAADSTGFSAGSRVDWESSKLEMEKTGHDWVKAHVMCGTKTHVVTTVEIWDRHAADYLVFPALLNATAANFTMNEVLADSAYTGQTNRTCLALP